MKVYDIDTENWHPEMKEPRDGSTIVKVVLLPELIRYLEAYDDYCNMSIKQEQGHNRYSDYPEVTQVEIASRGLLIADIKRVLGVK